MGVRLGLHSRAEVTLEQGVGRILGLRGGEERNCTMRSVILTDIIRVTK